MKPKTQEWDKAERQNSGVQFVSAQLSTPCNTISHGYPRLPLSTSGSDAARTSRHVTGGGNSGVGVVEEETGIMAAINVHY